MKNWHRKEKDTLSFGDRIADGMRRAMGSWFFVIGFLVFMAVWISSKGFGIDPAPFGQLNLALSAMAGLQASLIMIAADRLDKLAAAQAKHDIEVNEDADARIKEVQELQQDIHSLTKQIHTLLKKKK